MTSDSSDEIEGFYNYGNDGYQAYFSDSFLEPIHFAILRGEDIEASLGAVMDKAMVMRVQLHSSFLIILEKYGDPAWDGLRLKLTGKIHFKTGGVLGPSGWEEVGFITPQTTPSPPVRR